MIHYEPLPEGFIPSEMVSAEHNCRTCGQQTYLRPLTMTKQMLRSLRIIADVSAQKGIVEAKDIKDRNLTAYTVYARLKYWQLIEPAGTSAWRITDQGKAFLAGALRIPATLWIFNDAPRDVYGSEPFGANVYIGVSDVHEDGPTSREEVRESLVAIEQE